MQKTAHAFPANVSGPMSSHSACMNSLRLCVDDIDDRIADSEVIVKFPFAKDDLPDRHDPWS